jgi:hypothetical protein
VDAVSVKRPSKASVVAAARANLHVDASNLADELVPQVADDATTAQREQRFDVYYWVVDVIRSVRVPTYATAILSETPLYGTRLTTSDGVRMEWVPDMMTGDSGYCEVDQ